MEYFEHIRLLFILFMAYLSYRNIPHVNNHGSSFIAIEPESEEEEVESSNSQIEEENEEVADS